MTSSHLVLKAIWRSLVAGLFMSLAVGAGLLFEQAGMTERHPYTLKEVAAAALTYGMPVGIAIHGAYHLFAWVANGRGWDSRR